jgi:hypothetical protein
VARVGILFSLITFVVWVYTLVKVATTPEHQVRTLPKVAWVVIVVLFPLLGTVGWYVLGRPPEAGTARRSPHQRATPAFPEYDRPGRAAAPDPEKDEEFLRQVRERAEEQRRRYEQAKKEQPPTED